MLFTACVGSDGARRCAGICRLHACCVTSARTVSRTFTCISCSFWCRRSSRSCSCLLIASSSAFSDRASATLRLGAPPLPLRLRRCPALLSGGRLLSAWGSGAPAAALRSVDTGAALSKGAMLLAMPSLGARQGFPAAWPGSAGCRGGWCCCCGSCLGAAAEALRQLRALQSTSVAGWAAACSAALPQSGDSAPWGCPPAI